MVMDHVICSIYSYVLPCSGRPFPLDVNDVSEKVGSHVVDSFSYLLCALAELGCSIM